MDILGIVLLVAFIIWVIFDYRKVYLSGKKVMKDKK